MAFAAVWLAILYTGLNSHISFFLFNDDYLFYFFPPVFAVALGVGMCGEHCPTATEARIYITVAVLVSIFVYFLIGAVLGKLYGKFRNRPASQGPFSELGM